MAVIVCFEGRLDSQPVITQRDPMRCEAIAISNRYRDHAPSPNTTGTRYQLEAEAATAAALAALPQGTGVVVIGHVRTQRWTDQDNRTRYTDHVIIDSLGITAQP